MLVPDHHPLIRHSPCIPCRRAHLAQRIRANRDTQHRQTAGLRYGEGLAAVGRDLAGIRPAVHRRNPHNITLFVNQTEHRAGERLPRIRIHLGNPQRKHFILHSNCRRSGEGARIRDRHCNILRQRIPFRSGYLLNPVCSGIDLHNDSLTVHRRKRRLTTRIRHIHTVRSLSQLQHIPVRILQAERTAIQRSATLRVYFSEFQRQRHVLHRNAYRVCRPILTTHHELPRTLLGIPIRRTHFFHRVAPARQISNASLTLLRGEGLLSILLRSVIARTLPF